MAVTQTDETGVPLATALGQMIQAGHLVDCADEIGRELEELLLSWVRGSRRGVELTVGIHFDDVGRHIRLTKGQDLQIGLNRQLGYSYKLILARKSVSIGSTEDTYLALSPLEFQWQVCRLVGRILRGAAS